MPRPKSQTIYNWKRSGLICDDYNALYETYIKTMECQHCKKKFTKNNKRCMDHDHTTGLFRKIVCHRCNAMDSYIKYPNGYSRQEYNQANKEQIKEYRQANKEKIKEYYQANKEQIKEYQRANKDKLKEYHQEYRQANKDKIKEYKQEYLQANKQKIKEQKKEYYQANKAEISEQNKEKIECECGSIVRRSDIATHKRSKKHSDYKLNNFV